MKSIDVRREHDEDRSDPAQCLHAFDDVSGRDLLDEFLEESKRELLADEIRHQERAALRFGHAIHRLGEHCLHFRSGEMAGEIFPERNVCRLGQLENFPGHNALRDEGRLFPQRKLGRIESLHEARKHLPNQWGARSEFFGETILNETGESVVKTVRERQRSAALPFASQFPSRMWRKNSSADFAFGVSVQAEAANIPP